MVHIAPRAMESLLFVNPRKPENQNTMNDTHEIDFLASQVKTWEGEVTVARIQGECKIGFQKASAVAEKLGIIGSAPDCAVSDEPAATTNQDFAQIAVYEAATAPRNPGTGLGHLIQRFDCGSLLTCCKPNPETTDNQIGEALVDVLHVKDWTELAIGDLIVELRDTRGMKDVIPQIISHLNLEDSYKTLSQYAHVAKTVPNNLRELPNLRYSHLAEVACARFSKEPAEQAAAVEEILTKASAECLNVSQTREAVLNKKGTTTKPTDPPPEVRVGRFIVVYFEDCWKSYSCDELPDADSHHIVVDTQSASIACEGCSIGTPVWGPLVYEKLPATVVEVEVES